MHAFLVYHKDGWPPDNLRGIVHGPSEEKAAETLHMVPTGVEAEGTIYRREGGPPHYLVPVAELAPS